MESIGMFQISKFNHQVHSRMPCFCTSALRPVGFLSYMQPVLLYTLGFLLDNLSIHTHMCMHTHTHAHICGHPHVLISSLLTQNVVYSKHCSIPWFFSHSSTCPSITPCWHKGCPPFSWEPPNTPPWGYTLFSQPIHYLVICGLFPTSCYNK